VQGNSSTEHSRVFVVNDSGHKMDDAKRFGKLVPLTTDKVNIFATDRVEEELRKKLADYTASDMVLLSGAIILNILTINILMERFIDVAVLIYDFRLQRYVVRHVTRR
jgi:hypothetical protein